MSLDPVDLAAFRRTPAGSFQTKAAPVLLDEAPYITALTVGPPASASLGMVQRRVPAPMAVDWQLVYPLVPGSVDQRFFNTNHAAIISDGALTQSQFRSVGCVWVRWWLAGQQYDQALDPTTIGRFVVPLAQAVQVFYFAWGESQFLQLNTIPLTVLVRPAGPSERSNARVSHACVDYQQASQVLTSRLNLVHVGRSEKVAFNLFTQSATTNAMTLVLEDEANGMPAGGPFVGTYPYGYNSGITTVGTTASALVSLTSEGIVVPPGARFWRFLRNSATGLCRGSWMARVM